MSASPDRRAAPLPGVPRLPPGHIARHRVLQLLDASADASVIVVEAPAGAGKTTLLTEWARRPERRSPIAWVNVDAAMQTSASFWGAIARTALPAGIEDGSPSVSTVAEALGRGPAVDIVLDDFHLLPPDVVAEIPRFAALLQGSRLLLATRRTDALALAVLEMRVEVVTISGEMLALDDEELERLIAAGPGEGRAEVARVVDAIGRHALLLRLALTSGQSRSADEFTRLAAEWVLTLIAPEHTEAARFASLSPVFDDALIARMTGADAEGIVDALLHDGLGAADAQGMFAFHPVVRTVLRQQAMRLLDADQVQKARSQAADHLGAVPGYGVAAFCLLIEAQRYEDLWPFGYGHLHELFTDLPTVEEAFQAVPRSVLDSDGTLYAVLVGVRAMNEPTVSPRLRDDGDAAIRELRRRPPAHDPEEAFFRELAVLTLLHGLRRKEEASASALELEALARALPPDMRTRLFEPVYTAVLYCAIAHAYAGELDRAARTLAQLPQASDDPMHSPRNILQAFISAMRGDLAEAARLLERAGEWPPVTPDWGARLAIARAAVRLEDGDPLGARALLDEVEPILAFVEDWPYAVVVQAHAYVATDPHAGIEAVDRLLDLHGWRELAPKTADLLASVRVDLAIAAGDLAGASALVLPRTEDDIALRIAAARLSLVSADRAAIADLRDLVQREALWPRLRAQAQLLLAVQLQRAGSETNAGNALRRALGLIENYRLGFLLMLVPRAEIAAIAESAGLEIPASANASDPLGALLAPMSLTRREQTLLNRLTTGARLRDIADAEFVALSTIKSQAASLYRKLGVRSRQDAIEVAELRGIRLAPPAL